MQTRLPIDDIVNTDEYPIGDKSHPGRAALIEQCRANLERDLYCVIPNFIRPAMLLEMAEEAKHLRPLANDNNSFRNCYLQRELDPSLPPDHARNHLNGASTRMISYNDIPNVSALKAFYHSDAVRETVAEIVGDIELFDNEDPYQPANYVCYEQGDQSSWHFDSVNAFTMTLMVQKSESGGDFELSANTRTDTDQNYDHVGQVLRGERNDTIVSVGREPGALCIFRGCNSLHRVSKVSGNTLRIMAVFVYETEAGVKGDQEVNETVYGAIYDTESAETV